MFVQVLRVGSELRYVTDVSFTERRVRVTARRDRAAHFTQAQTDYYLQQLAAYRFPYQIGLVSA